MGNGHSAYAAYLTNQGSTLRKVCTYLRLCAARCWQVVSFQHGDTGNGRADNDKPTAGRCVHLCRGRDFENAKILVDHFPLKPTYLESLPKTWVGPAFFRLRDTVAI